jgi:hypothetical protein
MRLVPVRRSGVEHDMCKAARVGDVDGLQVFAAIHPSNPAAPCMPALHAALALGVPAVRCVTHAVCCMCYLAHGTWIKCAAWRVADSPLRSDSSRTARP